jgi:hypothetical protein
MLVVSINPVRAPFIFSLPDDSLMMGFSNITQDFRLDVMAPREPISWNWNQTNKKNELSENFWKPHFNHLPTRNARRRFSFLEGGNPGRFNGPLNRHRFAVISKEMRLRKVNHR